MLIFFSSCRESYFYDHSYTMTNEQWTDENSLSFSFEIKDTLQQYNLFLDLRHTMDYEYQNLYVKIDTKYPNGHVLSDTLSFDLANSLGDWNGKCNSSECDLRVYLANKIRFEQEGNFQISFSPFSRIKTITYVKEVSLRIQEYKEIK